jgi:UDP-4-amino-4,6-dideoxy-N-acetyl-beta-L-altrosamine N-acetyltransferase
LNRRRFPIIAFRKLQIGDKEKVRSWRNLPDVAKYLYSDHYITQTEHEQWFESIFDNRTVKYWIITYKGEDVGLAWLYDIDDKNKRCYWGFYVANKDVRGKGIFVIYLGSFVEYLVLRHVFDELNLDKLCCEVLAFNKPIIAMHKGFGFVQEGCFRRHIVKNGCPMDIVALAILREEWECVRAEIRQKLIKKEGSSSLFSLKDEHEHVSR